MPYLISDDYNRVVLEMEEGVPDSDYINASYVDVSFHYYLIVLVLFGPKVTGWQHQIPF